MRDKKTVFIIDDHPLFRKGIKSILEGNSGFEFIGEAGNGSDGVENIKKLKPDFVILDLSLPDQSGIDVARTITGLLKDIRIIVLSMHSKIDYITEAFRAGAMGYVVKESASEKLIDCLNNVLHGKYFIDAALSKNVVKNLIDSGIKGSEITDAGYNSLTPREQQITRLLAEGMPAKKIGAKLFISPKTVENHRANIMNKLELHSTMELIRYAARLGIIDVDLWKS